MEFVLVLPLFAGILMGIMDFGWLFYNYIGVENSARNAARIACVEYEKVNYNTDLNGPEALQEYTDIDYDKEQYNVTIPGTTTTYNEVNDLLNAAKSEMPSSVSLEKVTVKYSSDENAETGYNTLTKRPNGDVTVTVTAKMHVLTPILGMFSDHMQYTMKSSSTYKVEKLPENPININNTSH
ncbi:MAG: pilus assembly protein [Eubacterium sp.]|nr:pilus assembly protein [Eubacterium sp.]